MPSVCPDGIAVKRVSEVSSRLREKQFETRPFLDRGRTERRHVVATGVEWIGKEANQVGESGEAHPMRSATLEFAST